MAPNWDDGTAARVAFSWQEQARELSGLPGGGLNLAFEVVDRHAQGLRRQHVALRILDRNGGRCDISYAQLSSE